MTDRDPFSGAESEIIEGLTHAQRMEPPPPERKTKKRPHEESRSRRMMAVTFPDSAWPAHIRAQAAEYDLRPSDFLVYLLSYGMQGLERGEIPEPRHGHEFHHTAGETLDLPWEPDDS